MNIDLEARQDAFNSTAQLSVTGAPPRVKTASERVAEAFASLNPPTTTNLPSNYEIIQALARALERQFRIRSYWIMFLAGLCLVLSIACFVIVSYSFNSTVSGVSGICGGIFMLGVWLFFVGSLVIRFSHSRRPQTVAQGSVRYVMRIDGEQWRRFVTYFCSTDGRPSGVRGWWFCCQPGGRRYQRLLQRNHGYIVFGSLGFMVDELFCTTYSRHIVLNVELLPMIGGANDENGMTVDKVMRVWLCRRVYNARSGPPIPFKVDICLAAELPSYEIPGIVKYVAMG